MHVLDDRESTMAAAAITFYVAMRDALHITHGHDPMGLEESAEMMALADRLSLPARSVQDAVNEMRGEA